MKAIPAPGRAAGAWARADLRRRWRSLVALGVLVGAVAGLSAAAVAGARRTDSSFPRLRERTKAADAIAFPSQVGVFSADWGALARRPEVAQVARWTLSFGRVPGLDEEAVLFAASDRHWLADVDRPVVVRGRMFDPAAPDEVVVGEAATKASTRLAGNPVEGLRVGSVIDYKPYLSDQDDTSGAAPNGPQVKLRVVGVVRHVPEFLFVPGMIMLSPAFLDSHGAGTLLAENAMVRLRRGAADVPQLQRDLNDLVAPGAPVDDLHLIQRRVDTTIGVEHSALLLLAAAIAVAGTMLVGQALGRSVAISDDEVTVLRATGFDRASIALCTALVHSAVAGVGAVVTVAVAVGASRWFPVGLTSRIDPDRGLHADWIVLGPAAALVLIVVTGYAFAAGWRLAVSRRASLAWREPSLIARVARVAPLKVTLGTTMAFRRDSRSGELVRPALLGAVVGVLGVVGVMTIDHGLNDALAHPSRAGVAWDATVTPAPADRTQTGVERSRVESIGAVPVVAGTSVVSRLVSDVNGAGVPTFSVQPGAGTAVTLVSTSGRAPTRDDEAAVGPQTARQLHVAVGDTVTVGSLQRRVRIVGEALFPTDVHAAFDEGLWLTPGALDSIEPPKPPGDFTGPERLVALRFRPGADTRRAIEEVAGALGDSIADIGPAEVPPELINLRNVRALPRLLAGFLAVLAAAAVGHVLSASVRRRRQDFATLRALGLTRGGTRAILNVQGSAIAVVGLVVGIPLGVAVGRIGWRLVATRVPLRFVGPLALVALLVLAPAAVVLGNLLAVWPGRRVARLRPAEVLRAE